MTDESKFRVLCLFRDQFNHIKPVEEFLAGKTVFVYDQTWSPETIDRHNPDIVIGINEFHLNIARCYERAHQLNIPTLTIQDGILEWRFLFENPVYNGNEHGVPMHHPVIADKYACIGPLLANFISALGNGNKVEVTGMPKMDRFLNQHNTRQNSKSNRILILTSSKPWFYDDQKETLVQSLRDLKKFFDSRTDLEPVWRLTKGLEEIIGVSNNYHNKDSLELTQQLEEVDAVITTISTTIVESFIFNKPVCVLDYFNTPVIIPTVWRITSAVQVPSSVRSLLNPTVQELWFQKVCQDMTIRTDGFAANRVGELILRMIEFRKGNPHKSFPDNMMGYEGFNFSDQSPSLASFYPKRRAFSADTDWLKLKLIRAERENELMRKELAKRSFSGIILMIYNKLHRLIVGKR